MKSLEILEVINTKKEKIEGLKREIKSLYSDIPQDEQLLKEMQEQERKNKEREYFMSIGVKNFKDGMFILFNKQAEFKGVFNYKDKYNYVSEFERWLRKNKLYAHRLSSFKNRDYEWYNMSLQEQLGSLCWEFTKMGKLKNVAW